MINELHLKALRRIEDTLHRLHRDLHGQQRKQLEEVNDELGAIIDHVYKHLTEQGRWN